MTTRISLIVATLALALAVPALATGVTPPPAPTPNLTPEQRMQRRYPQPVKVGDVIGLPLLDDQDRTLGRITAVVRTPEGKLQLIIPYGGTLGFGKRRVAVPIEVVAIAGRQLAALDMDRAAFDAAPAWTETGGSALPPTETIRVALYKR
jgi:hypothetical protein